MNIEKVFIKKITSSYPGCENAIYSLLENDSIRVDDMQKFLIKTEFKQIIDSEGKVQKMIVYSDLAEKYCTTVDKVRHIIRGNR